MPFRFQKLETLTRQVGKQIRQDFVDSGDVSLLPVFLSLTPSYGC